MDDRLQDGPCVTNLWSALLAAAQRPCAAPVVMASPDGSSFSYPALIAQARALAGAMENLWGTAEQQGPVGLMMPTAGGTMLAFFALQAMQRVVAMINFNAGVAGVLGACQTAQIHTIVTSHAFIEAAHLGLLEAALIEAGLRLFYLEDILAHASSQTSWRETAAARDPHAPAVVLFTSGSEGLPKGVVLSHANIVSNVRQFHAIVAFAPTDVMFACLPLYHSFGLTVGALLPILSGLKVFFYPSPLHYHEIPSYIRTEQATIILSTSTFLAGYARCGTAEDFASLRIIVAGAEKLRPDVRARWCDVFGKEIIEGYGVTETAPVISVNPPGKVREGSIGFVLPGIDIRLEAIEGLEEGRMLWVRGPNVMLGYLLADRPGQIIPPEGGWHKTGDVVRQDKDGYLYIEGRMKRFAKIGGEMVSLAAIEAAIAAAWPDGAHLVLNVPHPRKGERLVLMTDDVGATLDAVRQSLRRAGLPTLAMPGQIVCVAHLPLLSSGKIDYVQARQWIESPQTADVEVKIQATG